MDSLDLYDAARARAPRRRAAQAGGRARAHPVRARPRPGRARGGVAAARGQDPGGRARRRDDFVRNRLTHSLEVAQVARDLSRALGCHPDIAETAALAHDLGHPPFGHNGERVLAELSEACGGFEGNAQTLRLLTRLEAKTFDADGRSVGLNLTRATLDACTKYPWPRAHAEAPQGVHADGSPRTVRKFGVYDDDQPVFDWLRAGRRGHPAVPRGAGHGPRRRRRLLRPRHRGRRRRRPGRPDRARPGGGVGDGPRLVPPRRRRRRPRRRARRAARAMSSWPTAPYDGSRRAAWRR